MNNMSDKTTQPLGKRPNGYPLIRPFVPYDVILEIFPDADDAECDYLLWNWTGYPSWYHTDFPDDEIRESLKKLKRIRKIRRFFGITKDPDPILSSQSLKWQFQYWFFGKLVKYKIISYDRFRWYIWKDDRIWERKAFIKKLLNKTGKKMGLLS
jgi:hypothetical protein